MLRLRTSLLLLLLTGAILSLASCRITGRQVDTAWLTDALTPPENDTVQVEAGRGGAASASHQATPAPPTAPARPGQASVPKQRPAATNSYVVQPGDTLYAIARRQGVAPSDLMAENRLTVASKLRPGQVLRLPHRKAPASVAQGKASSPAAKAATSTYVVRRGDTISGIAARHHVSRNALLKANGMPPAQASQIRIGQKLRLPSPQR